jgi:Carbohydrate binding domain
MTEVPVQTGATVKAPAKDQHAAGGSDAPELKRPRSPKATGVATRVKWASRVGAVSLIGGLALAAGHASIPAYTVANDVQADGQLVTNGGFEDGLTGWRVNDADGTTLTLGTPGRSGTSAATLLAQRTGTVALNDVKNTVGLTTAGTKYFVSAWMRATTPGLIAQLRVREVKGKDLVSNGGQAARLTSTWQQVTMSYTSASSGGKIDLNVVGWGVPAGYGIQVDDVSMRVTGTGTTATPTAQPTSTASVQPTPGAVKTTVPTASNAPDAAPGNGDAVAVGSVIAGDGKRIANCISARGIPSCGAFMGAAVGGNSDPAGRESQVGDQLGLRRTYYQAGQVDAAVRTAKADIAAGRVPWISFKPSLSWGDMAAGKGDAWASDLAKKLSAVGGPVWVAIHHEPENDGDIAQWTKMQERLSPILRSAPNVAYSIITTGWNQTYVSNSPYSLDKIWPNTKIDIVAFDPYNEYGVTKNGRKITTFAELKPYYSVLASFAAKKNIDWAIGETGYTNEAAAKDAAWLQRAYSDMVAMGGIGLSYFDSSLNGIGDSHWPLDTPAKVKAFSTALRSSIEIP